MKILFILITFMNYLMATEYFVYNPPQSVFAQFNTQEVFSSKEKEFLRDTHIQTNLIKVIVTDKNKDMFNRICRSNQLKCELTPQAQFFDEYSDKQWAIHNDGRIHENFISDIDVLRVQGVVGEDIQIQDLKETDKKIRIAVIDSGVDVNHPDLKNKIITNHKECRDLELYNKCMRQNSDRQFCKDTYASLDHNNNGYPLDCHGWNLSDTQLNPELDGGPSISDVVGHGTHVTGIIAAEKNQIGIQGVIQNVEILPVQVGVSSANYQSDDIPADKIAKAVLYAIKNNVDAINLSLGWRISQDSTLMREMIELALKNNIIIIAAGGNDGHTSPVYPCSYEGVICVGAHDEAGKLASFSNHGFHIDLLAPGTNILSTWPTNLRSKKFTINNNYEYMSGTSQAAPYVTGVVGLLLNQGISRSDIPYHLLKGTRQNPSRKEIKFGNLDFQNSKKVEMNSELILLQQKNPALISWSKEQTEFSFLLKFTNLSNIAKSTQIKINTLNSNIQVINNAFLTDPIGKGEVFEKRIHIKTPSNIDVRQKFQITIGKSNFIFSTKAINLINAENEFAQNIIGPSDLSGVSFKSFENYFDNKIDLLGIKEVNNKTQIVLIKDKNGEYESTNFLNLPAQRPVFLKLSKVDINLDQAPEYVVTVVENISNDERLTKFFIFNEELKPQRTEIFPKNTFDNKLTVLPGSFEWVKKNNHKVPMWIGRGLRDPSEQVINDPWQPSVEERRESRLYYLDTLGLKTVEFPKDVYPIQNLYSRLDNKQLGVFNFITTNTYNFYKTYEIYRFYDDLQRINKFELSPYMDLVSTRPLPLSTNLAVDNAYFHTLSTNGDLRVSAISLNANNEISIQSDTIYNQGSDSLLRLLRYDGNEAISQTLYELQAEDSSILSRVDIQRIKHHLLRTKLALYLPLDESLDFGSEYITLDNSGKLYSPANKSYFPINDCSEIETYGDSEKDIVLFLCPQSKKIIRIKL